MDQSQGECLVYSYKEGLFSAVAHDLKIRVTRWKLRHERDGDVQRVRATFDATSLRVICAVGDGDSEVAIADKDRATIDHNLAEDVLAAPRFPTVELEGVVDASLRLTGTLTLHGVARPIATTIQQTDRGYRAEAMVNQIDHRIKPYSAMLGTLKVKPIVRVVLSVPRTT